MDPVDTLGDALPRECARVREEVLPAYLEIGQAGAFAVARMQDALRRAEIAMMEGDIVEMTAIYLQLKGFDT